MLKNQKSLRLEKSVPVCSIIGRWFGGIMGGGSGKPLRIGEGWIKGIDQGGCPDSALG